MSRVSKLLIAAGLARLAVAAFRGESWLARVVLLWGVLPMSLISIGTSKLVHYAYPFWPPIGLGAGLVFAWVLGSLERRVEPAILARLAQWTPKRAATWSGRDRACARCCSRSPASCSRSLSGRCSSRPSTWRLAASRCSPNSSFLRPAFVAIVLFWLAGQPRTLLGFAAAFGLVLLLPLHDVPGQGPSHRQGGPPDARGARLHQRVEGTARPCGRGVVDAGGESPSAYYLLSGADRPVGHRAAVLGDDTLAPLTSRPAGAGRRPAAGLRDPGRDACLLAGAAANAPTRRPTSTSRADTLTNSAVTFDDNVAMLLPGAFRPCAAPMLAGGRPADLAAPGARDDK